MSHESVNSSSAAAVESSSYRIPLSVVAVRAYPAAPNLFTYPLCPKCSLPMEREYQRFCDHCGQALDWSAFSKAVIVLVNSPNKSR